MQGSITRKALFALLIIGSSFVSAAQPRGISTAPLESERSAKPYRILTNGKQVTIKSSKTIKSLMVWTSGGHRILEEKNVNSSSYNFKVHVNEKIFFIMVQLADGKTYSQKLGIQ